MLKAVLQWSLFMWIPGKGRESQTPYLQSNALLQRIIFTAFFCDAELPCAASFCWMRIWKAQSYPFAVYSVTVGRHCCWRCQNRAGVGLSPSHPLNSESSEFCGCQRHLFFYRSVLWTFVDHSEINIMIHVFFSSTLCDFSCRQLWSSQLALVLKQVLTKY